MTLHTASGQTYHLAGIAKGSGMIAPNMATLLGVIVTDAAVAQPVLQQALSMANEVSFNSIVVDGDTSTNDTIVLLANGAAEGVTLTSAEDLAGFQAALNDLCRKLAQDVVRDGEGATKFITLVVTGASDHAAARQIANTVATSALVKTAFFGNDANWGRIIAAAGRSGLPLDPQALRLWLTPGEDRERTDESIQLFAAGMPTNYSEERATAIISHPSVTIHLECGTGQGTAVIWTCDLSHEYVSINGDYRS